MTTRKLSRVFSVLLSLFLITGCGPAKWIGIRMLYKKTKLPEKQIIKNVCYIGPNPCSSFDQLDIYTPKTKEWPVIIFVHGGGWDEGDKQLRVSGLDVYGNIGRFYASKGIGVVLINYDLQPAVDWREQIQDTRRAIEWTRSHIAQYGGDPEKIFLMGHSAGAFLANSAALQMSQEKRSYIRGVISVSAAALDLNDKETYELSENPKYYEKRFRGEDTTEKWKTDASPINLITGNAPPFLIIFAGGEHKGIQRQSRIFNKALRKKFVATEVIVVPGESHSRIVLTLSRKDKVAGPAILDFVTKCCRVDYKDKTME